MFLASDRAKYITGQTLSVNGGMYMYIRHIFKRINSHYPLINTCVLALKMGKYNSLWIDTFKGGESTWKTSIK